MLTFIQHVIITSAKALVLLCAYVCLQDISNCSQQILMQLAGRVGFGPGRNLLNFCADPEQGNFFSDSLTLGDFKNLHFLVFKCIQICAKLQILIISPRITI